MESESANWKRDESAKVRSKTPKSAISRNYTNAACKLYDEQNEWRYFARVVGYVVRITRWVYHDAQKHTHTPLAAISAKLYNFLCIKWYRDCLIVLMVCAGVGWADLRHPSNPDACKEIGRKDFESGCKGYKKTMYIEQCNNLFCLVDRDRAKQILLRKQFVFLNASVLVWFELVRIDVEMFVRIYLSWVNTAMNNENEAYHGVHNGMVQPELMHGMRTITCSVLNEMNEQMQKKTKAKTTTTTKAAQMKESNAEETQPTDWEWQT